MLAFRLYRINNSYSDIDFERHSPPALDMLPAAMNFRFDFPRCY